jgi:hypothetical protein
MLIRNSGYKELNRTSQSSLLYINCRFTTSQSSLLYINCRFTTSQSSLLYINYCFTTSQSSLLYINYCFTTSQSSLLYINYRFTTRVNAVLCMSIFVLQQVKAIVCISITALQQANLNHASIFQFWSILISRVAALSGLIFTDVLFSYVVWTVLVEFTRNGTKANLLLVVNLNYF